MKEQLTLDTSNPQAILYRTSNLEFTILGGVKLSGLDKLKCTFKVTCKDQAYPFRTTLDLYHRDHTEKFIREVSDYFQLPLTEVRKTILALTDRLESYRIELYDNGKPQVKVTLTEQEEKELIKYLKQANLLKRLMQDISKTGIVKEEINSLLMYLVFTSRKLDNPLNIYTVGPSATGKTYLQHQISLLIPEEDKLEMTSLTNHALYYCTKEELDHKLLCIEDLDGISPEGMYMIRELQTSKKLTRTITERESNGNLKAIKKTLEARVSVAATTTREKLYEDNANRAIIIHPDTSDSQSQAIIAYQQRKAAGKINLEEQQKVITLLKNLQRILQPVKVINPLAEKLVLPSIVHTPRRTMGIYLTLIETISFIHQYQRPKKKDNEGNSYIETTQEDIDWCNLLLKDILLSKSDDISPAVRSFYENLKTQVKETFTAKEVRQKMKIPSATLGRYLKELIVNEYIRAEGNRYRGYYYSLREDDFKSLREQIEQFSKSAVDQ